jgi:asparagine synthase (glutamine-hydrolysing)
MSGAIWGIIHMDNKPASVELGKSMMDKLSLYKLDSIKYLNKDNVFMGCGLQYITNESEKEILPLYDENRGLIITADAIIDNREELFSIFNISKESWTDISDSALIIRAYEKWGQDSPKYLVGDFAFVIWDQKNKELFCARDHVGKRTFYYSYLNNTLYFCTVMKPLFISYNENIELNERWITDFLAMQSIMHESECEETVYKDIFQLPPAHTIIINKNGFKKNQYWNPLESVKPLKLKSDKEYDEAFKKVFFEAVHCRLRCNSNIGVMLSGGLDSGSVACVAARKLSKEGKRLKAFSSVPMVGFKDKTSKYYIADETEYIEAIKNHNGNIDVTYCRSEGKHSLKDIDWFLDVLEQPYKTIENSFWINEIKKNASEKGCKVLLDGQYGNCTISFGDFLVHILTLYRGKKFITLAKEIKGFSKLYKIRRYKISKAAIKAVIPYKFTKFASERRNRNNDRFEDSPINPELLKKWNVETRFDEKQIDLKTYPSLDLNEANTFRVNFVGFSHLGAIETKIGLAHGIMQRDPTRDKRVIEFCLSLPSDQYVRDGMERHLIRRSMEGILPDKVRLNVSKRGLQSADWIQRIIPEWESMCDTLEIQLNDSEIMQYVNVNKIKKELSSMRDCLDEKKKFRIRMLIITYILDNFIKKIKIILKGGEIYEEKDMDFSRSYCFRG